MNKNKKIYIGVVGQIACGKGVLVDALKKHGFVSFSLSSILHNDLERKGITKFTRRTLQDMGDELRKKYGRDILAKRAIKILDSKHQISNKHKIQNSKPFKISNLKNSNLFVTRKLEFGVYPKRYIIEGIRNTAEVEYLKSLPNFTLIGIKAKRSVRFHRLLQRRKPWDPKTWEEFLIVDRRDLGVGQKSEGQQVGKCLAYCDYVLTNNKDKRDFERKVKKLLEKINLASNPRG